MESPISYTLGLDVGIASIGWCLLTENRILDIGVRCFDKAENEKGEPKNLERRIKKGQRRRLQRRAYRLLRLRRACKLYGLTESSDFQEFCTINHESLSPWDLRAEGLDRKLSKNEWARVLYHIVKHRGFHSTRKTELKKDEEAGRVSAGLSRTKQMLHDNNWRTAGEMAATAPEFIAAKRNKAGDYKNTFARSILENEIHLLFESQRKLGSEFASPEFEEKILTVFSQQRPALTETMMLEMIGKCTFEKDEHRAAKHSWTAERFIWLGKLNNLRISENGIRRELTADERAAIIDLPYKQKDIKYKTLRTHLKKTTGFADDARFVGLTYRHDGKNPEDASIIYLKGWHAIKSAFEDAGLLPSWIKLKTDITRLDSTATALSILKTDIEIRNRLVELQFDEPEIEALLEISFSNFVQLSLKALNKIVPHMERGIRYDEACILENYHHSLCNNSQTKTLYLPAIQKGEITNPVVLRALNQCRKVINAIIRRHGSPTSVHIELGRDLSKPFDEREKIKKAQEQFQRDKQKACDDFKAKFGHDPSRKGQDLLKYRLYEEQQGKCAYSINELDLNRLYEDGYAEIDHVLPYSRSFDNSQNNQVLVLTEENRNKKNAIPFEYLDGLNNSERWQRFQAWVQGNKTFRSPKRDRLLRRSLDEREAAEFKERNLTDTRYLARFLKNWIECNLLLGNDSHEKVVCVNGQLTAFLRARWGLLKVRENGDKHHALDAAVVAAATRSLIHRVALFSRYGKLIQRPDGLFVSKYTGEVISGEDATLINNKFPLPWEHFRDELLARLHANPQEQLEALNLNTYPASILVSIRPLFVSRAPRRRNKGAAHEETIRSTKRIESGVSTVSTPLEKLSLKTLPTMVAADDPRNAPLYQALKKRLEEFGGDGKKAFAEPFFKPDKNGNPTTLVRSIKLQSTQKGGVPVRGGVADQASMIRVDAFKKDGKFFTVPIYQSDRAAKELPSRAVVAGKARTEWTEIDNGFEFLFSLHPNDVVYLQQKDGTYFGYFAGLDVATGAINILLHDRDINVAPKGLYRSLGIRTAKKFEKYHVDPLGQIFRAKQEVRHGLA